VDGNQQEREGVIEKVMAGCLHVWKYHIGNSLFCKIKKAKRKGKEKI
jgi:hypothetical protein